MMKYKGYYANPQYEPDDKCFCGTLLGIRDVVCFEGRTPEELEQAFRDSIDDYLAMCEEADRPPQKPYSGKFVVRVSSELHRRTAIAADKTGQSLNAFVCHALEMADDALGR
jgi:predicted HicB family RNase H-like nuclease